MDLLRKGHGEGDACPTATAVVAPRHAHAKLRAVAPVPVEAVEPAPVSTSQRAALVPDAPSARHPRTEPPPASSEGRARDSRAAAPVEVAEDERGTVEVPRAYAHPVPRRTVPAEPHPRLPAVPPAAARLGVLLRDAAAHGLPAEHCNGRACKAVEGCACPCDACARVRTAIAVAPVAFMAAPVSNAEHRIDALFWAKIDAAIQDRVPIAHCKGSDCNPNLPTCDCPCVSCDRRRTLHERAENEVTGGVDVAAVARVRALVPTVGARVEKRWQQKVDAATAKGANVGHCNGPRCVDGGEDVAVCDCPCEGCVLLAALLEEATREVAGGEG